MLAIILGMFSEALLDHFRNPRNAGELPEATTKIEVSNPVCGDVLQLAAVFEDKIVREARFLCRGCTASIACASLLTETMRGRESHGLRKITAESISEALGGLPEASFHAAQLARHALEALLQAAENRR
jgi:nitrogen fixation protein NifU and related proteins